MNRKSLPKNKTSEYQNTLVNKTSEADFKIDEFWEYCDNCGSKLLIRKCKLICPNCGFFHSCSEP